ncbi:F-box/kelch-repeat protein [Cardamine amara subsp. amara]|uniref:F-box/kelch-repeat protein n=1 Tax=Cardamine amara subsp. amara TaxID=228776 RepID=A0ABD1AEP6_CARAN
MNLEAEPPEKMKTKNSSPPPSAPSFSSLPEEITVNFLARISRPYYPLISVVSKTFHSILSSTELYAARSHLGSTEQCLYVCLWDKNNQFPQWFTLWINPNRTMKKKTTGLLVPIASSNFPSVSNSTIVVGSDIYVIGGPIDNEPSSAVRILDCRSHTWREAPSMNVARWNPLARVYDGKIYVMAGCRGEEDESWAEVFDTKTQTWEQICIPNTELRNSFIYRIREIKGKIHFEYYFQHSIKMYAYDPKQGKWEFCNGVVVPGAECVMDGVWYKRNDLIRRGYCDLQWSTGGSWRDVKGLESLEDKYRMNDGSVCAISKLVSCGGKLYLIWDPYKKQNPDDTKKIWCAEIVVEKRVGGEVWGNVQWVDAVLSVPQNCQLLNCIAVSV